MLNRKVLRQESQDATTVKKRIDAFAVAVMTTLVLLNAKCNELQDLWRFWADFYHATYYTINRLDSKRMRMLLATEILDVEDAMRLGVIRVNRVLCNFPQQRNLHFFRTI